MLRGALGSDTTVTWTPVSGAASYRIYWRRADEQQWTDHIDVAGGSDQEGLLKGVVVDDNFVGVTALGANGTESIVTFGGRAPRRSEEHTSELPSLMTTSCGSFYVNTTPQSPRTHTSHRR